jgi:hypothetical protein
MKTKLLLILLLPFAFLQAQSDYTFHTLYRSFEEGSQQYILRPNTPVYLAPAIDSVHFYLLAIAATIVIEERMDELYIKNGFRTNWYRISFIQNKEVIEGFIWGGDIAVGYSQAKRDSSLLFLYGIGKIELVSRGDYEDESIKIQINAVQNNLLLDQLEFEAAGTIYTKTQLRALGKKGLRSINQVLELAFSDGYCGGVSAMAVVFWSGNKLQFIRLMSNGFSDKEFYNQFFVYPNEKGGQSQTIIYKQQWGVFSSPKEQKITKEKDTFYGWNGLVLYDMK